MQTEITAAVRAINDQIARLTTARDALLPLVGDTPPTKRATKPAAVTPAQALAVVGGTDTSTTDDTGEAP